MTTRSLRRSREHSRVSVSWPITALAVIGPSLDARMVRKDEMGPLPPWLTSTSDLNSAFLWCPSATWRKYTGAHKWKGLVCVYGERSPWSGSDVHWIALARFPGRTSLPMDWKRQCWLEFPATDKIIIKWNERCNTHTHQHTHTPTDTHAQFGLSRYMCVN